MAERFQINGYTSKERAQLHIENGHEVDGDWDLMKRGDAFHLYFSSEENMWLKVPQNQQSVIRISRSLTAQKDALVLAQLVPESERVRQVAVLPAATPSLLAPHLGVTIEAQLKAMDPESDLTRHDDLSNLYYLAWLQANALLVEFGWWFDDPNPGNIVCSRLMQPVLIDFSNAQLTSKMNDNTRNQLEKKFLHHIRRSGLRGWWE